MQCLIIGNDEKGWALGLEAADYLWNSGNKIYLRSYCHQIDNVEKERELLKNIDVIFIFEIDNPAENRSNNYLDILTSFEVVSGLGSFLNDRYSHCQPDDDSSSNPMDKKIILCCSEGVFVNFFIGIRKIWLQPVVNWDSFQNFIDRFKIIGKVF
ncbi:MULTISPECIES: hypothetical protein [Sphingobacterium]|uniref:Uncharacterized protein n=1 Tax=Sphingobacterium tenebrionis TaxID=3111775 RepID=A0ABU8I3P8_9SPHI|nr:hypothetical protein [Sphingobacterium sp. CZ-2]QBR11694.1 hypothetical protein E3D81_05700 [Sphingobacterium sp. CZ-2]